MKKKVFAFLTIFFVLMFAVGVSLVILAISSTKTVTTDTDEPINPLGTVYYVDASAEKETFKGTSPKRPLKTLEQVNELNLQPGDTVLFKKDCRWTGDLQIKYSGTKEAPITYGMYGEGQNKPCIDGAGIVNATVWGEDISFVEIYNLEVTNAGDDKNWHRGISIIAVNENVEGIIIKNCYVHDVDSCVEKEISGKVDTAYTDKHWFGGIIVRARSHQKTEKENTEIILKDILVEGNQVDDCRLLGIAVGGAMNSFAEDKKCEGIVIRGNNVSNCWGDGIILFNAEGGLMEHNVSAHNGQCDDPNMAYVGIWVIWSNNTVIQYNESYGQGYGVDGQGFDIDGGCNGTIVQYNYSHDNAGGFLLLYQWKSGDAIVRYNVSVNDSETFIDHAMTTAEPLMSVDVYNNTFFTTKSIDAAVKFENVVTNKLYSCYRNNIFCVKAGENVDFIDYKYIDLIATQNNCYYGFSNISLPEDAGEQMDPKFAYAGFAEKGLDSLEGYKLLKSSPCLEAGMQVYNNGGLDFWGNSVDKQTTLNIGAYMGGAVERPKGINIALAQETDISTFDGILFYRNQMLAKLVDGKTDEYISTKPSDTKNAEEWFEVSFDDVYDISKVILRPVEDGSGYPVDFTINVCDENGEWIEVFAKKNCKQPKDGKKQVYTFDEVETNKIRINVTKLRENDDSYYAALSEIEVY